MINRSNSPLRAGLKYLVLPILFTGLVVAFHLTQAQATVSLIASKLNEPSSFKLREGTIEGFVVSANLNKPLAGVSVSIKGQQVGTLTDENGRFRLYTNKDKETLSLEHADYEFVEVGVTLGANRQANVGVILQSYTGANNKATKRESWQAGKRDQLEIEKAIFIRDGERRPNKEIKNLNPNQFYVTFLNKKEAINAFGVEGKYGAVIATPQNKPQQKPSTIFSDTSRLDKAIFIIDGKKQAANEMEKLAPHQIASMTILKGQEAAKLYGAEGENGVIIITTKSSSTATLNTVNDMLNGKLADTPLYIIDGKESTKAEFEKLDPNAMESIVILKDKAATDKYGDKGKNNVVEIVLKKK